MPVLLTIGQLAERADVAVSALRFYEDEGLLRAERTPAGQRRFHRDALRRVAFVKVAQRLGASIAEIRDTLDSLPDERTPTVDDWATIAEGLGRRIDDRIAELEALRRGLDGCIGCGCLSLDVCALYNPDDAARRLGTGARYLLGDSSADAMTAADDD